MESLANKAALGELTLGEVWELVRDRFDSVLIVDQSGDKWGPYGTTHFSPGVGVGFSGGDLREPEIYHVELFDLNAKVKLREDRVELEHDDGFGDVETLSFYFYFRPEPEVIRFDHLLPGGVK